MPSRLCNTSDSERPKEAVDKDGNIVDLTKFRWMSRVVLPRLNAQEVYRKIQEQAVREHLPPGTKVLLRVNCLDAAQYANLDLQTERKRKRLQ